MAVEEGEKIVDLDRPDRDVQGALPHPRAYYVPKRDTTAL